MIALVPNLEDNVKLPVWLDTFISDTVPAVQFAHVVSLRTDPAIDVYSSGTLFIIQDVNTGKVLTADFKEIFACLCEHLWDNT